MLRTLVAALVIATILPLAARSGEATEAIRRDAMAYFEAMQKEDYARLATLSYGKVVSRLGGPEKFAQMMQMMDQMRKAQKVEYGLARVVAVSDVVQAGPELHSIVEVLHDRRTPAGETRLTMFLLAISDSEGETWMFIDAERLTPENRAELFPEFNDALTLPSPKR